MGLKFEWFAGRAGAAWALAALATAASAQIVDEVDLRREGADAVLVVRFATEVQFQRMIATRSGDLVLVSYQLIATTNARLQSTHQVLRLPAARGLPEIEIGDETDRGEQARRLVVRLAAPVAATARAGRGNRSIEIVLKGKGAGLAPSPPPRTQTPAAAPRPATPASAPSAAAAAAPAAPVVASRPASAPAAGAGAPTLPVSPSSPVVTAVDPEADALMARAREAFAAQRWAAAIEALDMLLERPPAAHTAAAQEMAGQAHLRRGDAARARAEFETYLQLFPQGEGAERVRRALAALPPGGAPSAGAAPSAAPRREEKEVQISGSTSVTGYGGNGQVRSRDFQDSPIAGLPQIAGEEQLSGDRTRQLYTDVDFNWRRRNAELDQRLVLRDSYTRDQLRPEKSRNRLSALYADHRSLAGGWGLRLGRQSPTGGGVMGRFDGISANYVVVPRVKLGAVAGDPTDRFFESRRRFWGASVDGERVLGPLGGSVYAIEQRIDGVTDRRALGLELRWFRGGATVFAQFDRDLLIRANNIATVQGTLILADNTVINALYDRRALTTLTLGNALTFGDPANPGVLFRRIQDKLATTTLEALRDQVRRTTPTMTQAQLGITKPWSPHWQTAASVQLTNTGAIPPVPEVAGFEAGRPATGNIVTTSAQLIGLNLYSARDTHVLAGSVIAGPLLHGALLSYNLSSFVAEIWQFEPSLQFYRDRQSAGTRSRRWTPGLRITYRGFERLAVESSLTYELGRATRASGGTGSPAPAITTQESTHRVNYSLGVRWEF